MANSTAHRTKPRRWRWSLPWFLLTVYFVTPPREAYDHSLDKSNYATYSHFLTHDLQWGDEVLPMSGPLGFILYGHTYSGELYTIRLVGDILLKAAFVILLLRLFHRAGPGAWRWIWMTGVVLMVPTVDDLAQDFAILISALVLITEFGPRPTRWSFLACLLMGAIALMKGNHPATVGACFSTVILLGVLERQWRTLAWCAATLLVSVTGLWLLAGQELAHVPRHIRAMLELSAGYNASMGLDELPLIKAAGVALAIGLALVLAWTAAAGSRQRSSVIALLLIAGMSFIKWKHGYVRADGHVFIFFASASIFTLTACLVSRTALLGSAPAPLPTRPRLVGLALVTLVTGFAVVGAAEFWLWRVYRIGADVPEALQRNARYLARPNLLRARLDSELELNRRAAHVPQIQNEIGSGTVDFFGFEQGLLLLNGFNYHPRPMGGGSFNVFTAWLQDQNEAFVRDPKRAPAWQVLKLQTIDGRFPAADDPLTLRAILDLYSPVLMQRDYLLLRRRDGSLPPPAPPVLIGTRMGIKSGELITAPDPGAGRMLLFQVDAPLSATGSLRSFVYRAPELHVRLVTSRQPLGRTFVLKPTMLHRPVILSPLLVDNLDVIQLFGNDPGNTVRSLQLEAAPGFDDDGFTLSFLSVARPAPPEDSDIEEIATYMQHPLYNRMPFKHASEETGIRELNKEPITIVHAPGDIAWNLEPDDQQVIFSYGLMPQTYLNGGATDGVEFVVEAHSSNGTVMPVFRRFLQPLTNPADRGMQRARVYLPPRLPAGSTLWIRTEAGPAGNGAWDQSYITRLQIKKGLPDPRQYFGFNITPIAPGFAPDTAFSLDGRPVRGIHPPAELGFPLPSGAQRVVAGIGIMPGAYQGENRTDGVGFTFLIRRPDGTTDTIARRMLDPLQRPADRGIQTLEIKLPAFAEGSILVLRTDAGPDANLAWDWAVVQTLYVE